MNLCAFCTSSSYKIKKLFGFLRGRYKTTLFRDVVHVEVVNNETVTQHLFFFPYGATICWGMTVEEGRSFVQKIHDFEDQPLKEWEEDDFHYTYGDKFNFIEDKIVLADKEIITKLAISHGLAQSVKLGAFEDTISDAFEKNRRIPEDLAKKGKIYLSRKQIRQKMGELFIDRSSINLHADVLDTPEFFWEHPELEPLYTEMATELEIETRGQILNQRLDVVRELFEMLGNELNHQHSSRLEWTIIWLIVIEVVVTLLTHYHVV